mmetsp:Transcript_28220/g.64109  ORF Transcript_28220/g.64109 Transcript_28220/m.64109 type:complete len:354 (+) Transcript_28220:232-1293(+)
MIPPLSSIPQRAERYLNSAGIDRREAQLGGLWLTTDLQRTKLDSDEELVFVDDSLEFEGKILGAPTPSSFVLAHHKVAGVEMEGLRSVIRDAAKDLGHLEPGRVCAVGRLDKSTTGLILCTDDGDLNYLISAGGCVKQYSAVVRMPARRLIDPSQLDKLVQGVDLKEGPARAVYAQVVATSTEPQTDNHEPKVRHTIRLAVTEGRYHLVKRLLQSVGLPVFALHREKVGQVDLQQLDIQPGTTIQLHCDMAAEVWNVAGGFEALAARRLGALICRHRQNLRDNTLEPRLQSWLEKVGDGCGFLSAPCYKLYLDLRPDAKPARCRCSVSCRCCRCCACCDKYRVSGMDKSMHPE